MKSMKNVFKVMLGVTAVVVALLTGARDVKADPDYFYIELLPENDSVTISAMYCEGKLEYTQDLSSQSWTQVGSTVSLSDEAGHNKVYFRAQAGFTSGMLNGQFEINGNGNVKVGGNIMTLLSQDGTRAMVDDAFTYLFTGCRQLVDASELILPDYVEKRCYMGMFNGCSSLKKAPLLPATNIASQCYALMFQNTSIEALHVNLTDASVSMADIGGWLAGVNAEGGKFYGTKQLYDKAMLNGGIKDFLGLPEGWSYEIEGPTPGPNPDPKPAKESESTGVDASYMAYLRNLLKADDVKKAPAKVEIDRDTFKSEAPAHTVIASETATDAFGLFDLKVHKADEKSAANQEFLAKTLVGPSAQILLTQNIYPRRDLATAENGALKKLTWNNLPKDQAGPAFAVVYNETDGAYVINGTLDANGTAAFQGFKLRPASTITICK